jgi:mannopine transport system substrate-binding protein
MTATRRQALAASAALGLAALPGSAARAQSGLEDRVVIRTTGGVFEQALKRNFFDPFTRATGVRVIPVAATAGEMLARTAAMQQAGRVEWDIISPQYDDLPNLAQFLVDLGDCSAMPAVREQGVAEACGRYGVLYLTGAEVLAYDPRAFPNGAPTKWADFWDLQRFPGRRALSNTGVPWSNIIHALVADGVPPAQLFPLDLDRAFRKLDQIKPHIAVWWRTGDQSQQIFRNGDVVMGKMWSGRAFATKRAGTPLAWTYNESVADFGSWAILRGAPHPNAARAFIDFYMRNPEAHAAFGREMGYATSSQAAQALLTAEEKADLVATPETFAKIIHIDAAWLAANRAPALERWNRWISA